MRGLLKASGAAADPSDKQDYLNFVTARFENPSFPQSDVPMRWVDFTTSVTIEAGQVGGMFDLFAGHTKLGCDTAVSDCSLTMIDFVDLSVEMLNVSNCASDDPTTNFTRIRNGELTIRLLDLSL